MSSSGDVVSPNLEGDRSSSTRDPEDRKTGYMTAIETDADHVLDGQIRHSIGQVVFLPVETWNEMSVQTVGWRDDIHQLSILTVTTFLWVKLDLQEIYSSITKYLPLPLLPMRTICGFACEVAIHCQCEVCGFGKCGIYPNARLVSQLYRWIFSCRPFRVHGLLYSSPCDRSQP